MSGPGDWPLADCPKCGAPEDWVTRAIADDTRLWSIDCLRCGFEGPSAKTETEAIRAWNDASDNAAEAAHERQQQSLMESAGPDDSSYRRDMQNAGRGHLLKG